MEKELTLLYRTLISMAICHYSCHSFIPTGGTMGVPIWLPVRVDAVCVCRHYGLQSPLSSGRPIR